MKKNKKGFSFISTIVILVYMVITGKSVYDSNKSLADIDKNLLPITPIHGSFICDIDNVQEMVGLADYVFVGTVISDDGTHYEDIAIMEDEKGNPKEVGIPFTDYTVQVVENIKGNLLVTSPVTLVKEGGISQDHKSIYVFEKDSIPKEGESYIFLTYAQPDGSLLVSGPNSNIHIDLMSAADTEGIGSASAYNTYKSAYENESIPIERERFISIYEQ